jgi:hypothetical protein
MLFFKEHRCACGHIKFEALKFGNFEYVYLFEIFEVPNDASYQKKKKLVINQAKGIYV